MAQTFILLQFASSTLENPSNATGQVVMNISISLAIANFWSSLAHLHRPHLRLSYSIEDDPPLRCLIFFADFDLERSICIRRLPQSVSNSSLIVDLLDSSVPERYEENSTQIPHPSRADTDTYHKTASPWNIGAPTLKRQVIELAKRIKKFTYK